MKIRLSKLPFANRLVVPKSRKHVRSVNDVLNVMGMTTQLASGLVSLTPISQIIRHNIERRAEKLASDSGFVPTGLPFIFPVELTKKSGQYDKFSSEFYMININGNEMVFCPTTEEPLLALLGPGICSYKQLPIRLFHPHHVFRNIKRPKGLFATRDFEAILMSSIDVDREGFRSSVECFVSICEVLFAEMGISVIKIGGKNGEIVEFLFNCDLGDRIIEKGVVANRGYRPDSAVGEIDCSIRFGNIAMGYEFNQVEAIGLQVQGRDKSLLTPVMGTFGIGTQRCLYAMFHEAWRGASNAFRKGFRPFDVMLVPLDKFCDESAAELEDIATFLSERGHSVAIDDRQYNVSEKLDIADFLSVPIRVLLSQDDIERGKREIRTWRHRDELSDEEFRHRLLDVVCRH